jgi:nitrogen fixation-related uncharacterized protein
MNTLIITITVIVAILGISVVLWSIIDTRNKYYNEYVQRKKK